MPKVKKDNTSSEERFESILRLAEKYNATDIHFLLKGTDIKIEMRVNNEMRRLKVKYNDDKLIRYLQYRANLDMGKQLEPQTGHFEHELGDNNYSLRFAVINGYNYCNAVLRILNHNLNYDIDHMITDKSNNEYIKEQLKKDSGLILLSGPTGSGKTTTAYTLLKTQIGKKIYTIEDPVETYCDDFIQLQINEAIGFDYDSGIKQLLRHDPDIIMIGEIRDSKAAKMAVVATQTGHLVISTIHAGDNDGAYKRMLDLGVDKEKLDENLLFISNQRLLYDEKTNKKSVSLNILKGEDIKKVQNIKENENLLNKIDKALQEPVKMASNYDLRAIEKQYHLSDGELDGCTEDDIYLVTGEEDGALDNFIIKKVKSEQNIKKGKVK